MAEANDPLWTVWECSEGWRLHCAVCDAPVVDLGTSGLLHSKKGNPFVYHFASEFEDRSAVEHSCDD
uniref:Uncharacterized protein n=1 Tax=Physcomitrium patens TaxID=3218 RepID=A0A2K1IG99_PHYPA|nr:hypothetical protein PHYPA_028894 [Physcomitrium patens]